jgi:hypothetical protein
MEEMEVASYLKRGIDFDLSLCVICQSKQHKNSCSKTDSVVKLSATALVSLQNAAESRKKKKETEFCAAIAIIDAEFEINEKPSFVSHWEVCHPNFTNQTRINRLEDVSTKIEVVKLKLFLRHHSLCCLHLVGCFIAVPSHMTRQNALYVLAEMNQVYFVYSLSTTML